ncbi:hypothetical protein DL240_09475 [Lujinxingia litoralis]|uniref:Uncharacterized protein n=1 Tax=Lujinxingia litoralis TaxID=2211119 RepID=A0A328CBE4_9DELT|nr:hypothetical protein [Lujinxingia litoralis]RAL23103.1 hypothetical protein DL240_09475 [Lujinxingia litoralis]
MDTLDVVKKAEERGGRERREAIEQVLISARRLGCDMQVGGGQAGGMNLRYGAIGYAILDVNTRGVVKLYASPHPGKEVSEEHRDAVNAFIEGREALEPKSFPVHTYGHLENPIEEIGSEPLVAFVERAVQLIRRSYYEPWRELHEA